jgi:hypothetical protein
MTIHSDPEAVSQFLTTIMRHGAWTLAPDTGEPFYVHPDAEDPDSFHVAVCVGENDLLGVYDPAMTPNGATLVGYHWPAIAVPRLLAQIAGNGAAAVGIDGSVVTVADAHSVIEGFRTSGVAMDEEYAYDSLVAVVPTATGPGLHPVVTAAG